MCEVSATGTQSPFDLLLFLLVRTVLERRPSSQCWHTCKIQGFRRHVPLSISMHSICGACSPLTWTIRLNSFLGMRSWNCQKRAPRLVGSVLRRNDLLNSQG